jgi:hypothetical protein
MDRLMDLIGVLVLLALGVFFLWVLYLLGGWVLSTFGVVGLIIFLIIILGT